MIDWLDREAIVSDSEVTAYKVTEMEVCVES